jgi:hypothetical protein
MRLQDYLRHPIAHGSLVGVLPNQHHERPENIEVANTTLSVFPLPGGPSVWDIPVPYEAQVVIFSFRSNHTCSEGAGKAGVTGVATRSQFDASTVSTGGHGTISTSAYNAVYSKRAAAMNLSHKVFSSVGSYISLTEIYLYETAPLTRVLRTEWTNYGAALYTLNCWGEVAVLK